MTAPSSRYPHFWLYAKCWYKQGDVIEDTKQLIAHYCGGKSEYISLQDCFDFWMYVHEEAVQCCRDYEIGCSKLMNMIWKRLNPIFPNAKKIDPRIEIIGSIVTIIQLAKVKERGESLIDFGKPDPSVLPLSVTATQSAVEKILA